MTYYRNKKRNCFDIQVGHTGGEFRQIRNIFVNSDLFIDFVRSVGHIFRLKVTKHQLMKIRKIAYQNTS